tara:strand:- start:433 stop:660 length:228 start_codon:yes stop_codon:yes gene_type:complete
MNQMQVMVTQTQQPDGTVRTEVTGSGSHTIKAYILGAGIMVLNDNLVAEEQARMSNEDGSPKVHLWTPGNEVGPN